MPENEMEPFYGAVLLHSAPESVDAAGAFTTMQELTPEDHKRYEDAYHEVDALLNTNVFTYVKTTMNGFVDTMELDAEELRTGRVDYTQPDDIVRMGIRMRSAVLAFCSALHFHQEHNYKEVVRRFGENSREHKRVQRVFNRLFEKSAAYRLLYHTRNTMVHHTMETVALSATAFLDDNGESQAFSAPTIDVSAIVDLNTEISDAYRNELRAMEENPLVLELIVEAMPLVVEANDRILGYLHSDLDTVCAMICEFDKLFEGRDGVRCLTDQRSTNTPPPVRFSYGAWAGNVILYARKRVGEVS